MMSNEQGRVLVVDDDVNARSALVRLLRLEGYEAEYAQNGEHALLRMNEFQPDVVVTDLKMPKMDGLELLEQGRKLRPFAVWIVVTAFGSIDTAIDAIRKGASNYLTKPLDFDALLALLGPAMEKARLRREAANLREQVGRRLNMSQIIGEHPSMQRVFKVISQVANSRATVLVQGESGTGKELIAAALHYNSRRRSAPFVRLNCAALAPSLLDSELFGHEKGAFTGAVGRRIGKLEAAHTGTLFLDEVSEMSSATQVKLLRFLQERQIERVGSNAVIDVDARIVAACNRDLQACVDEGSFRQDLYYRLNVISLEVPPLRLRRSDIPLLVHFFSDRYATENEKEISGISDKALRLLSAYRWPGNVRELENAIERAVVMCEGNELTPELFPGLTERAIQVAETSLPIPGTTMAELERIAVSRTLQAVGGSTAKAARILDMSQRTLQHRVKTWKEAGVWDG